ncbi:hypothetical protein QFW77_15545 [Luteimonas sp. RD2P54]|uniref:Glycine zipper-like domain-containing protein n=1 Tax=Luteimonas endophytica TaxID=3042023 RepID=A0ABT6JC36_9GAMM|nr:hypothetical protein [Luteimonas endophytica]MDH5824387.1 hypothetical protein [Luteimonas endophytica]
MTEARNGEPHALPLGAGVAIGVAIGVAPGTAMDNPAVGIGIAPGPAMCRRGGGKV